MCCAALLYSLSLCFIESPETLRCEHRIEAPVGLSSLGFACAVVYRCDQCPPHRFVRCVVSFFSVSISLRSGRLFSPVRPVLVQGAHPVYIQLQVPCFLTLCFSRVSLPSPRVCFGLLVVLLVTTADLCDELLALALFRGTLGCSLNNRPIVLEKTI